MIKERHPLADTISVFREVAKVKRVELTTGTNVRAKLTLTIDSSEVTIETELAYAREFPIGSCVRVLFLPNEPEAPPARP